MLLHGGFARRCVTPQWPASRRSFCSAAAAPPLDAHVLPAASHSNPDPASQQWLAPTNLVLIGGRGCGKSSVARRLASLDPRWTLLSADALIRYDASGQSVAEIVSAHGWPGFRDAEHAALLRATSFPGFALIDAGGGAVVDVVEQGREVYSERKAAALRRSALVVYIKRRPEYLQRRVDKRAAASVSGSDSNRPALGEPLAQTMARREAWYERCAHVVVDGCDAHGSPVSKEALLVAVLRAFAAAGGDVLPLDELRKAVAKQAAGLRRLDELLRDDEELA